jgi:large repetitive protein
VSTPQPGAGVVSRAHSAALAAAGNVGSFSDPEAFDYNIVWQNRQFYFWVDTTSGCTPGDPFCTSTYGLCPDPAGLLACTGGPAYPQFSDLGVIGAIGALAGTDNLLTGVDILFVSEYFNGARSNVLQPEINTGIQVPAAFDEGGNFIRPGFGPLSLTGDYHILDGSLADGTAGGGLTTDFDSQVRPQGGAFDIGADEIQ